MERVEWRWRVAIEAFNLTITHPVKSIHIHTWIGEKQLDYCTISNFRNNLTISNAGKTKLRLGDWFRPSLDERGKVDIEELTKFLKLKVMKNKSRSENQLKW